MAEAHQKKRVRGTLVARATTTGAAGKSRRPCLALKGQIRPSVRAYKDKVSSATHHQPSVRTRAKEEGRAECDDRASINGSVTASLRRQTRTT